MSWYKIAFTDAEVEDGAPGRMEKEFRTLAGAHGPNKAVLFSNELAAEGIEYYLPPATALLIGDRLTQYAAQPCDLPPADHVRLAFGSRAAARRLLDGH